MEGDEQKYGWGLVQVERGDAGDRKASEYDPKEDN